MKIYFCDICNESIPLQDLKDNLATTIKGKLFCQACNPLNTVTPSASSSKTAPWAVWALLVLLTGAVATLGYMVYELSSKDQSQSLTARIDGLVEKVDNVAANMTQAEVSLFGFGATTSSSWGRMPGLESRANLVCGQFVGQNFNSVAMPSDLWTYRQWNTAEFVEHRSISVCSAYPNRKVSGAQKYL